MVSFQLEFREAGQTQALASGFLPISITEHGPASADKNFRKRDLRQNLAALHRSIQSGTDVRAFFYWSLLDSVEWQFGYAKKFGLLAVDFADETLPRTMKPLAGVYSKICPENLLVAQASRR